MAQNEGGINTAHALRLDRSRDSDNLEIGGVQRLRPLQNSEFDSMGLRSVRRIKQFSGAAIVKQPGGGRCAGPTGPRSKLRGSYTPTRCKGRKDSIIKPNLIIAEEILYCGKIFAGIEFRSKIKTGHSILIIIKNHI